MIGFLLVITLSLLKTLQANASHDYKITKKVNVLDVFNSNSLLNSIDKPCRMSCLNVCSQIEYCLSVVYMNERTESNNCFLYNKSFNAGIDTKLSSNSDLYIKDCSLTTTIENVKCINTKQNLVEKFLKFKLRDIIYIIDRKLFINIGFTEIVVNGNLLFYVGDYQSNTILIFNEKWILLESKSFPEPRFIETIENELFITNYEGIHKVNSNLEIIKKYTYQNEDSNYRMIYYSHEKNLIYVPSETFDCVDVFDKNLNLIESIPIDGPFSINGYEDVIYVGSVFGSLSVIKNNIVVETIHGFCNSGVITTIYFDKKGYVCIGCNSHIQIYSLKNQFKEKVLEMTLPGIFTKVDSKGRIIIERRNEYFIYY